VALTFAVMAPHGFSLIPEMREDAEGGLKTRSALEEMGRRCSAAAPDVIVIATPHGFRVNGSICVADAARGAGTLRWDGRQVEQNIPFDRPFVELLVSAARERGLPIAVGSYAGVGANGVLPLDWGVITPLWFAAFPRNMVGKGDVLASAGVEDSGPAVVVVCPARDLESADLVAFGEAIAEAAERDGRTIAYIASCDWSHRHSTNGPYGYSDVAAPADARIVSAMQEGDLNRLTAVTQDEVRDAAMDGLAQTLILAGVINCTGLSCDLLSYEAPTYYGMIVATYQ
jgi:aromatic ring-opening dioxygenase LigB subunit